MTTSPGRLQGKTAIVTGASRGIGRAIAIRFAAEGARLGLVARGEPGLIETAKACTAHGAKTAIAVADVTDSAQVARAAAALRGELGPADVVVNNAGGVLR
jgi:3-oxoacyl-[acyl-carrier protein] reductase